MDEPLTQDLPNIDAALFNRPSRAQLAGAANVLRFDAAGWLADPTSARRGELLFVELFAGGASLTAAVSGVGIAVARPPTTWEKGARIFPGHGASLRCENA